MAETPRSDGGPAFPPHFVPPEMSGSAPMGMSLRDWFAGQAIIGQMAMQHPSERSHKRRRLRKGLSLRG